MDQVDFAYRTMYAELLQRSLDASFDETFPPTGNFVRVPVKGRDYWYFEDRHAEKKRRYVGLASDQEIARRVEEFGRHKEQFRGRRKLVSTLVREARLSPPDRLTGSIVEALERAGLFRLRAVLIGTVAFQTYPSLLGVRLPVAAMQTGDADFAQFHSIANEVDDEIRSILSVLRSVDPTFRPVPHIADGQFPSKYVNATSYSVEFLTPNTGSDGYADRPARMPSLGDTAAQPLRFLDFLIFQPVRAVMLHAGGVPVLVPTPERYAVHKLIVASERRTGTASIAKRDKDLQQAAQLIEALAVVRQHRELGDAFIEAWERGPQWRAALKGGLRYLPAEDADRVGVLLTEAVQSVGRSYRDMLSSG
jgi:hypothetical protein